MNDNTTNNDLKELIEKLTDQRDSKDKWTVEQEQTLYFLIELDFTRKLLANIQRETERCSTEIKRFKSLMNQDKGLL